MTTIPMTKDYAQTAPWTDSRIGNLEEDTGMTIAAPRPRSRGLHAKNRIEFRLLFAIAFIVFFLAGLAARLTPGWWMSGERSANRPSLIEEARTAAGSTIPFAFMG